MTECYNCSGDHYRRDCPQLNSSRSRPAPGSAGPDAGPLSEWCPLCQVAPGHTCRNITTDKPMYDKTGAPVVHPQRTERVWRDPLFLLRRQQIRTGRIASSQPEPYNPDVGNDGIGW